MLGRYKEDASDVDLHKILGHNARIFQINKCIYIYRRTAPGPPLIFLDNSITRIYRGTPLQDNLSKVDGKRRIQGRSNQRANNSSFFSIFFKYSFLIIELLDVCFFSQLFEMSSL